MPKTHPAYAPEFRRQIIDLVRAGRSPADLAREFEPSEQAIRNWSLVTGLGLLPLAIGMGDPGREVEGPMALVILGGLLTSMALNLLILPALALRFGRFQPFRDELADASPELIT